MAGENEIRGTKNLGLIQAIYSGLNPPMNTKIIWYDDNVGVKIHKYYDVTISQWIPFGGNGSVVINGHYVYIAYASDCSGADFSLNFDDNIYTHTSIISSLTAIPANQLIPELFAKKWIKFCGDDKLGGNYTYIGFADDCEGTNFSTEPTYEVKCDPCEYVDEFIKITPEIPNAMSWSLNPQNDGVLVSLIANSTPQTFEIDLKKLGLPLINGLEYTIEMQIDASLNNKFYVRLDGNEVGGYSVIPDGTNQTLIFTKINNGSHIFLEFYESKKTLRNDQIFFKIGNKECWIKDDNRKCYKCRKCWALITSEIPILELTAENFKGKWICECGCDTKGNVDVSNLQKLIYNISDKQVQDNQNVLQAIIELSNINDSLAKTVQSNFNSLDKKIDKTSQALNLKIEENDKQIITFLEQLGFVNDDIKNIKEALSDDFFNPRVIDLISKNSGNLVIEEKLQLIVNSSNLQLNYKNGDRKYIKSSNQNTVGIQDNIYTRNGFIGNYSIEIDEFGDVKNLDTKGNPEKLWEVNEINNLILNLDRKTWNYIKNLSPFIQITRYKHSRNKGFENEVFTGNVNSRHRNISGFKLIKNSPKFKPSRININSNYQVIDFGQEHYFKTNLEYADSRSDLSGISTKGLPNRFSKKYISRKGTTVNKSWVYLEFQIGYIYNKIEYISNPLNRIKMILFVEIDEKNNLQLINNVIKFKYV